jgi:hypothetical protein
MLLILKYFWFICAAFMLVNVAIWRQRLTTIVSHGLATKTETDRFIRLVTVWLIGGSLALGIIGLVAGWSSPFCAGMFTFDSVATCLASLIALAGWVSLLWWIWRGGGASFLARVAPALGQRPSFDRRYSEGLVRVVVTALVLIGGVGGAIMWRAMPQSGTLRCQAPIVHGVLDSAGAPR